MNYNFAKTNRKAKNMTKFSIGTSHMQAIWRAHCQLIIAVALGMVGLGLAFFGYLEMSTQPGNSGTNYRITINQGDSDETNHIFSASDDQLEQLFGDSSAGSVRATPQFGYTVAFANANLMAISSINSFASHESGAVYIFEKDADSGQWQQVYEISASDSANTQLTGVAGSQFGYSLDFKGSNVLAIGVPDYVSERGTEDLDSNQAGAQLASGHNSGAVFIFTMSGSSWQTGSVTLQERLVGTQASRLGSAVAFSSNGLLAVGATGALATYGSHECGATEVIDEDVADSEDYDNDNDLSETIDLVKYLPCAEVILYDYSSHSITKSSQQLPASKTYDFLSTEHDGFGGALAFSADNLLVVGSPGARGRQYRNSDGASAFYVHPGAAFLFSQDSADNWQADLKIADVTSDEQTETPVADLNITLSGDCVYEANPNDPNVQMCRDVPGYNANFAQAVAFIDSDTLAIGSDLDKVFLFSRSGSTWTKDSREITSDLRTGYPLGQGNGFGRSLDYESSSDLLAIGSPGLTVQVQQNLRLFGVVNLLGLTSLHQATTWHYVYIEANTDCSANAFSGTTIEDYIEGSSVEAVATINENQRLCFRAVTSSETEYLATAPIDLSPPDLSNASLGLTAEGVLTINFGELVRGIDDSDFGEPWAFDLRIAYRGSDDNRDTDLYQNGFFNQQQPALISISNNNYQTTAQIQIDMSEGWPESAPTADSPLTLLVTIPANFEDYYNNTQTEAVVIREEITAYQAATPIVTITFESDQHVRATDDVDDESAMTYSWLASNADCDNLPSLPNSTPYTEGSPVRLEESHNGQQLCFTSTDVDSSLVGYAASRVIEGVDRTPPVIKVDLQLETIAISVVEQGSGVETRTYVILSDPQCGSSTDFSNAITYSAPITIVPADHAGKYFCFRVVDAKGNPGYIASGAVGTAPVITAVTVNQYKIDFERTISTTITFSEDIIHDLGADNASDLSIRFNSQRGNDSFVRFRGISGNQVIFEHRPKHGDYTPGVDTADPTDDEYFDLIEILLGDDSLADVDGNPAILTIADAVNVSSSRPFKVDLRVPTVTITNPTDLTSVVAGRTFSAVDDWAGNNGLENNGYSDFWRVYVFEYYFVPVEELHDDSPINSARSCQVNGFSENFADDQRFSYIEGEDVDVTEEHNNHHICFRSRRPGDEFVGGRSNSGFVGGLSALIQNIQTPKPTVAVTAGNVDNSFKATDNYDLDTIWKYQFINATTETCDSSLNWASATAYTTEAADVVYTTANNGQRLCFQSQDTLSEGYGYGQSIVINLESIAPRIISLRADAGAYGANQVITITVTFSEEVILSGGQPRLVLDLPDYPAATYVAQPTLTTMTFSYTVVAADDEADLNVYSFRFNGSTIQDSAQNNLDTTLPAAASLSSTGEVTLDTQSPTIQLSILSSENGLSATASDNHDDSVGLESAKIPKNDSCLTYTGSFEEYIAATVITITDDEKACFRATDDADNSQTIGSLPGNDITPPTLDISDPGTTPASNKVFEVGYIDDDLDTIAYKLFNPDDDTCGRALMSDAQTLEETPYVVLVAETDNGQQVCFAATDSSSNTSYWASATIGGIDVSPPRISLTYLNETIVVAVSDASGLVETSLVYALIAADYDCNQASIDEVGGSSYTDGTVITVTDAHVGSKFCFAAEDILTLQTYQDTKVIAADNTAPEITVTSPDGSPAQTKLVRATSATDDVDDSTWVYRLYRPADDECDLVLMGLGPIDYTVNSDLVLDAEEHNGQRVCFSVSDNANNPAYRASEVIGGIDRTPPTATITDIATGYLRANDDDQTPTTWHYLRIGADEDCQLADFSQATGYREASSLALTAGYQGQRVCLMVTDIAGNSARAVSDVITKTVVASPADDNQPDEQQPPAVDAQDPDQPQPQPQPRPTTSEISDLSDDDGGSSALTLTIGLVAIFVIIVLVSRSRRNRSQRS